MLAVTYPLAMLAITYPDHSISSSGGVRRDLLELGWVRMNSLEMTSYWRFWESHQEAQEPCLVRIGFVGVSHIAAIDSTLLPCGKSSIFSGS